MGIKLPFKVCRLQALPRATHVRCCHATPAREPCPHARGRVSWLIMRSFAANNSIRARRVGRSPSRLARPPSWPCWPMRLRKSDQGARGSCMACSGRAFGALVRAGRLRGLGALRQAQNRLLRMHRRSVFTSAKAFAIARGPGCQFVSQVRASCLSEVRRERRRASCQQPRCAPGTTSTPSQSTHQSKQTLATTTAPTRTAGREPG